MPLFAPRRADPLTERQRALADEIRGLEAQISELSSRLETPSQLTEAGHDTQGQPSSGAEAEPVFERFHSRPVAEDNRNGSAHFNDLGVRKYDLIGTIRRLQGHFRGPASTNPRLISYLAAGSIQGLRPLRYEKRVARNRVLALSILLLLVLWGLIAVLRR